MGEADNESTEGSNVGAGGELRIEFSDLELTEVKEAPSGIPLPLFFSPKAFTELNRLNGNSDVEGEGLEDRLAKLISLGIFFKEHVQDKGKLLVEIDGTIQELDFKL